ncbi:hypothetical protein [Methanolapillus millepedarum]
MDQTNPKKLSASFMVSQQLLNRMNSLVNSGKFSSISDIISTSVSTFLGKISIYEEDPDFDYSMLNQLKHEDKSPKEKITISQSPYIMDEIDNLSKIMNKPKSYVIRIAVDNFIDDFYKVKPRIIQETKPEEKFPTTVPELKKLILKTIEEQNQN